MKMREILTTTTSTMFNGTRIIIHLVKILLAIHLLHWSTTATTTPATMSIVMRCQL